MWYLLIYCSRWGMHISWIRIGNERYGGIEIADGVAENRKTKLGNRTVKVEIRIENSARTGT